MPRPPVKRRGIFLESRIMWITPTTDHVKARLAKDELDSYLDAIDQAGDGIDVMAGILSQVVSLVRGKVASNRDNLVKMGAAGTIPDECLFAACTIARDALVGSLPLSEGASDVRKTELRLAHEFLTAVAKGDVRIEDGSGAIPETAAESDESPTYGGNAMLDF